MTEHLGLTVYRRLGWRFLGYGGSELNDVGWGRGEIDVQAGTLFVLLLEVNGECGRTIFLDDDVRKTRVDTEQSTKEIVTFFSEFTLVLLQSLEFNEQGLFLCDFFGCSIFKTGYVVLAHLFAF